MNLINYIQENYSPTAVNSHYNNIKRYQTYIGEKAQTATCQDVLEYIALLRKQKLHPKTIRNYLFAVKIYYNYLQQNHQRKDHPCKQLHLKDQINRAIPTETLYTEKQLQDLLQHYQALDKRLQQRNHLILSLLVNQALTISEISHLQLQDIHLEKGQIHIKASVQLKERTLALKPNQILLIYHYINQDRKQITEYYKRNPDHFILTKYANQIRKDLIRRLLKDKTAPQGEYTPIKIRQSVITHLLKNHNLRVVQVFAGHCRSSTTEAYKQTTLNELKDDIRKVHPLK